MTTLINNLSGYRILVTGASSGIGRATSIYLAELGADVVLCARDEQRLHETLHAMPGGNHSVAPLDLSENIDDIPAWIKRMSQDGPFHGLVHCAGIEKTVPVRLVSQSSFEDVLRINTEAALMLTKGIRQKKCFTLPCSIVFISSVASLTGQPGISLYCASKGALNAMARALAVELARQSIRVNTISPGHVETEMNATIQSKLTQEQYAGIVAAHPLGLGRPEDVAGAAAFLLSDNARWITGTNMVVDGGYTAQ